MEKTYQSFETLLIWQEGMQICYLIYDQLKHCRDFGLKSQMERSAVSIPSNIAEGYELNSDRGFIRHLYIAKGSCGELRSQFYRALDRNYISQQQFDEFYVMAVRISAMLQKLIEYLQQTTVKGVRKKEPLSP